jgi:hypothetical protein
MDAPMKQVNGTVAKRYNRETDTLVGVLKKYLIWLMWLQLGETEENRGPMGCIASSPNSFPIPSADHQKNETIANIWHPQDMLKMLICHDIHKIFV